MADATPPKSRPQTQPATPSDTAKTAQDRTQSRAVKSDRKTKSGHKAKVLFLCLGNSCRSQMAEALARHLAPDVIEASSAGLIPLGYIAEPTVAVLSERGVECEGQSSKPLTEGGLDACDLLVNMSGRKVENFFDHQSPPVEDWEVGDPFGSDLRIYENIRDEIERRVVALAERLRAQRT